MRWPRLAFPLAPALLALPLMAPNCPTGPVAGSRQFGDDSIVIPMDECWQPYQNFANPSKSDTEPAGGNGLGQSCSKKYTPGVLYAYGLVYYLVQNGINVYWIIDPNKTAVTDVDFSVPSPDGGAQATLFDFDAGTAHDAAHGALIANEPAYPDGGTDGGDTAHCAQGGLCYRGGPFIIDGADFKTVYGLLSDGGASFAQFRNNIQLHVIHPTTPFTAFVNRTLAGNPPKIGILAVPDVNCFQTAPILTQYLQDSALGIDAGGIYDNLYANAFDPDGGSFANSTLAGYNLLWIPHFVLDNGASKYAYWDTTQGSCTTQMTKAQASNLASVIGQFVATGNNLFAECAGIGAMEGSSANSVQSNLSTNTEFMTFDAGVYTLNNTTGKITISAPATPFLQIGDFPFVATSGYIGAYEPNGGYIANVQTLVFDQNDAGVLSWIPSGGNGSDAGTVVYLGGHSYTNYGGVNGGQAQNIAGERMVLNTLLSLSAKCVVPADAGCSTGLPGPCGAGQFQCVGGALTCVQMTFSQPETCNGVDDDCNGLTDDGIVPIACYDGGTAGSIDCQGMADAGFACGCHAGSSFCINGQYGACEGASYPQGETCNGIDDDCDGFVDNAMTGDSTAISAACYDGPPGTEDAGLCSGGTQYCVTGTFGMCQGEVTPVYGLCDGLDHNCDGLPDTCQACAEGQKQPCYDGPAGTVGVGLCKAGIQTCVDGGFGACAGEIMPDDAGCDGVDHNCDGYPDLCQSCTPGDSRPCYTGAGGTEGVGICRGGTQACDSSGNWGACNGQILPTAEICDGVDESCSGAVDTNAPCTPGNACVNGSCVPSVCGGESNVACPPGYACDAANGCQPVSCSSADGGICPTGNSCIDGGCVDPCLGVTCGSGSICAGGQCLAGGCTSTGCPTGQICVASSCVPDPCQGVSCPDGTFCRSGFCLQACGFVSCGSGETCDQNGNCVPAPCGGSCQNGQVCSDGGCGDDPCTGVKCAIGQVCQGGGCIDDPCNGIHCPGLMACADGQCVAQIVDGGSFTGGTTGHHGPGGDTTGGGTSTGGSTTGGQGSGGTQGGQNGGGQSTGQSNGSSSGTSTGTTSHFVNGTGCGCGTGSGGSASLPLGLVGLALLLRRRRHLALQRITSSDPTRRNATALSLCLAVTFLAPGFMACSGNGTAGTNGGSTTGTGTDGTGTGGVTGSSSATNGGSGTNGTGGTSGGGCAYEVCAGNCVDLANDTANCGTCGHACQGTEICVVGACGQEGLNPHLDSLSPDVASVDSQLTVTLAGTRFQSGAQVLLVGAGLPANDLTPASFVDASTLTASLSFSGAAAGTVTVAVVNPGGLISNTLGFTLSAPGVPVLQSVNPMQSPTGLPATLTFTGQNLNDNTAIHVEGGSLPNTALPTSCSGSTSCTVNWDLSEVAPGNYSVFAVSPGALEPSNSLSFAVTSTTPVLTSATPSSANAGAQPSVEIVGSGFDSTSKVGFGPTGTALALVPTTYVSATQIFATLDLNNLAPGAYQLEVTNNGGLQSNLAPFTVTSAIPTVLSLSPSQGASGTIVPLNVGGVGFDPSSTIHFQDSSGGGDTALTTSYNGATSLASNLNLGGLSPGSYQVLVSNSGGLSSTPFPFTVTSNTPTVTGVDPASLAQSAGMQNVALTGSNFTAGMTVQLTPLPSGAASVLNATLTDGQNATVAVDPSLLTVAGYLLTVINPGNFGSNAANFSVTPGTPTLTSLTPSSSSQQQVTVVVCGQYFLSTSTVHVTGLNGSYSPSATFGSACPNNAPSLSVSPDLTSASPGDYTVTVWNSATLQSNAVTFTVNGP